VHEALSEKGFRLVDVRQVLEQVAQTISQHRRYPDQTLQLTVEGDEITLPSRSATSLTLAVNELLQNALKHAFVGREAGQIQVRLRHRPPGFEVEVRDDGVGSQGAADDNRNSLGLQIVDTLVSQDLGGQLEIERDQGGTCATIRVPNLSNLEGIG
jgi:two-component sensor histidine kinase